MKKGSHHTEETKQKNRGWHLGKIFSEEHKQHLSENHRDYQTEKTKQKISEAQLGRIMSEESKQKNREGHLGKQSPWKGKKASKKTRQKMSKSRKLFIKAHPEAINVLNRKQGGENNGNWKGGISFELYTREFNNILKQQIRERDDFGCQLCWKEEERERFAVHHIDYNKKICNQNNLITLCRGCNAKVNANRPEWTNFFSVNLAQRGLL